MLPNRAMRPLGPKAARLLTLLSARRFEAEPVAKLAEGVVTAHGRSAVGRLRNASGAIQAGTAASSRRRKRVPKFVTT
jgi:hypothetical protein